MRPGGALLETLMKPRPASVPYSPRDIPSQSATRRRTCSTGVDGARSRTARPDRLVLALRSWASASSSSRSWPPVAVLASACEPAGRCPHRGDRTSFLVVDKGWATLQLSGRCDRLDAEPPGVDVELLTSSTVASSGRLTVLEMAPLMNGCTAHHADVPGIVNRVVAHRTGEDRQVLGRQWGARRCLVRVDVGHDLVDLAPAEPSWPAPSARSGDDRHRAAATSFLVFTSPRSGSTPVVSQSSAARWCPSVPGRSPGRLRTPKCSASSTASSHAPGRGEQLGGTSSSSISRLALVHPQDIHHGLGVLVETGERHAGCGPGRGCIA